MPKRYKHIGIVAVSSPGAALCYQTICTEFERITGNRYEHPEASMHSLSFKDYMDRIESGDWKGVADLLVVSSEKLAAIGADFAICPDNTVHIAFDEVVKRSPIPWMHIAEEVAKEAREREFNKLVILGTKFLTESGVYPSRLKKYGIDWIIPDSQQRRVINDIIFNELVYGVVRQESKSKLVAIIKYLAGREGGDAVVLGCTELPLILDDKVSPIPVLDSTRILARRALREAVRH
ncbi:MAG: amino acid racemase [Desulfurococcales archaeon]|nr:amino acid racemase [Desulfurococcales archaeon]